MRRWLSEVNMPDVPLHASSTVFVFVPGGSMNAPVLMSLSSLRDALAQGRLPLTALAQQIPTDPWRSANELIRQCADFNPRRPIAIIVALGATPVVLLFVHLALFGTAGAGGPLFLVLSGLAGGATVARWRRLRSLTSAELVRSRLFIGITLTVLFVCEGSGVAQGLANRSLHAHIAAAIRSADPCNFEKVIEEVQEKGTDDEKAATVRAKQACDDNRYAASCDRIASHIKTDAVTANDLSWLAATAASRSVGSTTGDVVQRLVRHQLDVADLALSRSNLLCEGSLWPLVVNEIADSSSVWASATEASDDVKTAFIERSLGPAAQTALLANVNSAVVAALKGTSTSDMESGRSSCSLGATFHVQSIGCNTLERKYAILNAREGAAQKAKSANARDEAIASAEEEARRRFSQARQAEQEAENCELIRTTWIQLCQLNCPDQYSSLDPGPSRDDLIAKCESGCYGLALDAPLPKCD